MDFTTLLARSSDRAQSSRESSDKMTILITIITPTVGCRHLRKLLQSLNELEGLRKLFEIEHFVVVDNAPIHSVKANTYINEIAPARGIRRYIWNIPFGSGEGNYKGHRIYAGISQFVNGKYTLFLDDDNYLHPFHIMEFLKEIPRDYDWQYSLREIVDQEDRNICLDQCESLGHLAPVYYDPSGKSHLIDTNCYFIKSEVLKEISPIWNRPAGYNGGDPDRLLGQLLMTRYPKYRCTREYSVAYRVGTEGGGGVSPELFKKGNPIVSARFGSPKSPWTLWEKPILYLIHFNRQQTKRMVERIYSRERDAETAFKQWQLNLFDSSEIRDRYIIMNAYSSQFIPSGSVIWIHMCNPGDLPREIMERGDLNKILYTIESPNVRHQAQWNDTEFLSKYFTKVITYWNWGQSNAGGRYPYYPFIHRCDMQNPEYRRLIDQVSKKEGNREKSVAILLENRSFEQSYQINGVHLRAQDALRRKAVLSIAKFLPVVCYGDSWRELGELGELGTGKITVRETPSRFLDQDMTIEYYGKHYFAIVIENCDAVGYVSEKIYDVWMTSGIPIYYGNIDDRLRDFLGRDIPIDKMMIDMKKIGVENIGDYMSELYVDEIEEMQALIETYKERILERVGIREYAKMITQTVDSMI